MNLGPAGRGTVLRVMLTNLIKTELFESASVTTGAATTRSSTLGNCHSPKKANP